MERIESITQHTVEEGSRVYTGSVYPSDPTLFSDGFRGERLNVFASSFPRVSSIKTHHPLFAYPMSPEIRYGIQVLRNPFDALISEFNREHGKGTDPHTNVATVHSFRTVFPDWFKERGMRYWGHARFWNGPRYWEDPSRDDSRGTTSLLLNRQISDFPSKRNQTIPVLVLFYEDFVRNFVETSRRMFDFLRSRALGRTMPSPETSVVCALYHFDSQTTNKRTQPRKHYNPYTDPLGGVATRGLVRAFCDEIKDFWFADKWGDCYSAPLQSCRDAVIAKPKKLTLPRCSL